MRFRSAILPGCIGVLLSLSLSSCIVSSRYGKPDIRFAESPVPPAPDYTRLENWAAHPDKKDNADLTPGDSLTAVTNAPVDVFWIHPTIYTYTPNTPYQWNADVNDTRLNRKVDNSTIKLQASAFNGAGNIYAPRYRQAHLYTFMTPFREDHEGALDLAYQDVKAAFVYYLEHWNQGRPFIIASHSQGTRHAVRLLQEMIDGKDLQRQLVAAYIVGYPTLRTEFTSLPVCQSEEQTKCLISWSTYAYDYVPGNGIYARAEDRRNIILVNPLHWKTTTEPAPASLNSGGLLRSMKKTYPGICDAEIHDGLLWAHPPQFPGSFLIRRVKNYHTGDYNLFYMNVRRNAALRSAAFLRQ